MSRKRRYATDTHHLIPRSRCKELGIDPNFPGNTREVRVHKHRLFHQLFGNMTPDEIIDHIRSEWSLSPEAQRTFKSLCRNVELMRRRR